ncbi:MAG TPA: hypothetical protein VGM43_07795 [Bryobacteraceae bacterium]|jgi:hypothetical protein
MRSVRASGLLFLIALATTCSAQVQVVPTPAELSSLPLWPGEQAAAKLSPPRYVFRDANGEIVVSYATSEKPGHRVLYRFWLPNRVAPEVTVFPVRVEGSGKSGFIYNYKLRNAPGAISTIADWSIVGPANQQITVSHPAWKGSNARVPVAPQGLLPNEPAGAYLIWRASGEPQLSPGQELGDFTIESKFLPGLTTGYAEGDGVIREPEGEFPEPVVDVLTRLQRAYVWQKPFLTVGPRFAPGTPRAEILAAFRRDMASLIDEGLLSAESPYVHEFMETSVVKAQPQSPIENDIATAFRASVAAVH